MYRLHDFECKCGNIQEELVDVPPKMANIHCKQCNRVMSHCVVGGKAHTFKPFWHPHLGQKPVYITSWKQYQSELRKRNYANDLAS